MGIELAKVRDGTVANNSVWSVTGGAGGPGGDATALRVAGSAASVLNNTLYSANGGPAGWPEARPGKSRGLWLAEAANALVANNALVSHGVGVCSASSAARLDHNDLWDNQLDYEGLSAGRNDLHVAPRLVDAENGDFHLRADSPLIDAGTNRPALTEDFEAHPRPLDGDYDCVPTTDIGADEYWPPPGECTAREQFVPEPASLLLLGAGLVGLAGYGALRWRRS